MRLIKNLTLVILAITFTLCYVDRNALVQDTNPIELLMIAAEGPVYFGDLLIRIWPD